MTNLVDVFTGGLIRQHTFLVPHTGGEVSGLALMENREIRRQNARIILEEAYGNNMSKMARELTRYYPGTVAPSTVRRWFYEGADARNIGQNMARLIEKAANKPVGWLDSPVGEHVTWEERAFSKVPILNIEAKDNAAKWKHIKGDPQSMRTEPDGYVNVPLTNPDVFAVCIAGDAYAPAIRSGWFVVLDPHGSPRSGDWVAVRKKDGTGAMVEYLWHYAPFYTVADLNTGEREEIHEDEIMRISLVTHIIPASQRIS